MRTSGHKASYAIKNASKEVGEGRRSSFAIQAVDNRTGARKTLTLEPLTAINRQYQSGAIAWAEARRQVEAVRDSLYTERDKHKAMLVFCSENVGLLERYWAAEYGDRDIVDRDSMWHDLRRAVSACGTVSLLAATKEDLQAAINKSVGDSASKQRRVVARLNSLLRFAGREFKLRKMKAIREDVLHLTYGQLTAVLPHLPDDHWRALARAAFVSGLRLGELYALTANSLRTDYLLVATQIDEAGQRRETKTRTVRKAAVLPIGGTAVAEWMQVPEAAKADMRAKRHSTIFKRACKKAFPKQSSLHCRFHDLRHSYAVYLISERGVPIGLVAQSLGNSVAVCERYYSGFVLTDAGIETIRKLLAAE